MFPFQVPESLLFLGAKRAGTLVMASDWLKPTEVELIELLVVL